MFSGQPVAKDYLVKAIVFDGKIGSPKNIGFGPYTFIPKQLCYNIIKHILFLRVKILREREVELLTDYSKGKLIDIAPNKHFSNCGSPWTTMLSLRLA